MARFLLHHRGVGGRATSITVSEVHIHEDLGSDLRRAVTVRSEITRAGLAIARPGYFLDDAAGSARA